MKPTNTISVRQYEHSSQKKCNYGTLWNILNNT